MGNNALIWTFAGVIAAACFARGLAMTTTFESFLWYTLGALSRWRLYNLDFIGAVILIQHRIVLGTLGALFGSLALLSIGEWIKPTSAQAPQNSPIPSVNGNCNNFGNSNINCNTFNINPGVRRLSGADANNIASALVATKVKGSVGVQTDLIGCVDCDSFARQMEAVLKTVPGWTVIPTRNGMTLLPFKGIALGIKNKNSIPESAKALVTAFAAIGGKLEIIEFEPPQGADSVIIVAQAAP